MIIFIDNYRRCKTARSNALHFFNAEYAVICSMACVNVQYFFRVFQQLCSADKTARHASTNLQMVFSGRFQTKHCIKRHHAFYVCQWHFTNIRDVLHPQLSQPAFILFLGQKQNWNQRILTDGITAQ